MKINQVEELVGITKKNIRFYEDQGLLTPNRNPENGYRDYNLKDVDELMRIKLLRKLAVPIEEIRQLQNSKITFDMCMEQQIIRLNHEQHDIDIMKQLCERLSEDIDDLSELKATTYLEDMNQMEIGGARFMDIERKDVKKKKYGSLIAAAVVIAFMLIIVSVLIWAKITEGMPTIILAGMIIIHGVVIVGTITALVLRFKEINGGEEDEASKY